MSKPLRFCTGCAHYEQQKNETFYCKLHDLTYSVNQDNCEDLEEKENYESTSYECD